MLAVDVKACVQGNDIKALDTFFAEHKEWIFGHLSYDLKDVIHFQSKKKNRIDFPGFNFFVPEFLIAINDGEWTIAAEKPHEIHEAILSQVIKDISGNPELTIQQCLTREEYIEAIKKLQAHILRGDCYEINFCQEFFCEDAVIEPIVYFQRLMDVSPNPFSAFYKLNEKFLLCASPERFLAKTGTTIISQPIKGTIKRALENSLEDKRLLQQLKESKKDQSENVMVVDLVRNDLAKICKEHSVTVNELFGIYSYPQVHQMISTISGELKENIKFSEILEATFPMGSMTGAPKFRVMQLIDEYEKQSRGIFSGAVGYFSPEGNFDFNVVIRSIMYNANEKYLSYQVGSGITFYSDPEKEWEECLLKAEAIKKVLRPGDE